MDIHFHAFISYRHHPDDIKVAMQVHRALEHYHIPRSLKKKLNVRGPMRLFRDKEELPITSNLNDDIDTALRNSDYLIVICSVHTKESIWVQREIALFLKTHPRSRVLTVLASGEPYDVIPEILLHDDKIDPVTGQTVRELVEPLSCDWRMGRRKAMREELPRLAAPLLGCSYDELRQRQRQYRLRRLITFFSLALAVSLSLAAYFLQTSITIQRKNVQIQANLENSQRNQSRHLATAARERLAEGDRLTAIALASAALPGENNVRPYVPEAEKMLIEALDLYQQRTQATAVGTIRPDGQANILDFYVSPSGKLLILRDDRDLITFWDTVTLEKRGTWDISKFYFEKLLFLPDDTVLLRLSENTGSALHCITPDCRLLWKTEVCDDVAITDDGATVLVLNAYTNSTLTFLDAATGKPLRDAISLDTLPDGLSASAFFTDTIPGDFPIPLRCITASAFSFDDSSSFLFLLEPQDGSFRRLDVLTCYPDRTMITADGKLVLMTDAESDAFVGTFESSRVNAPMRRQVCCYEPETGKQLWQTQIDSSMAGTGSLHPIPDSNWILCQSGPVFQVVDASTGETQNRCEAGSRVLAVSMEKAYAQAILEDGYLCKYWYYENYCFESSTLQGGLNTAAVHGTQYYALQYNTNYVTVYRQQDTPALWQYSPESYLTIKDQRVWGNQWVLAEYDKLHLLDMDFHTMRWSLELPNVQLLDFSQDAATLWAVSGYEDRDLITIDTATGKYTATPLEKGDSLCPCFAGNGWLCYTRTDPETLHIFRYDLQTGENDSFDIPLPPAESAPHSSQIAGQQGQYLWIWANNGLFLEVDCITGAARVLAENVEQCPVVTVKEDGSLVAAANGAEILVMTPGGEDPLIIAIDGAKAGSVHFMADQLLALCDNGYLYRYDTTGTLLSRTELETGSRFDTLLQEGSSRYQVSWHMTREGKLVINACGTGNVIECEGWKVSAVIPDYRLYRQEDNSFASYSSYGFTGYPCYSIPQLLELADKELEFFHLTDNQKHAYGIA